MNEDHMTGPLWKGRFAKAPSEALMEFSSSLPFDRQLWRQDIEVTRAHAAALVRADIITADELLRISKVLAEAEEMFEKDTFQYDPSDEDIHTAIERFLTNRLGDLGARIHAGRSRNDMVVTDLRLWLKDAIPKVGLGIFELQSALNFQATKYSETPAPGYTHLQRAQPIIFGHQLLAHAFALVRDFKRMESAFACTDVSCLGAAAFAGTTLPLDPKRTAEDLGFSKVFDNSADAVADRDFALEFLSAAAILGVHLSRLGEEIVLWTTREFSFAYLDDSYATGSSIMPQKKNPDIAELARAKSARITSNLVHLLGVMKGLPLAYNRDIQEDKEPVFDAVRSLTGALHALAGMVKTMKFDTQRMQEALGGAISGATDLAEALAMKGIPFREAHEAVAGLARRAQDEGGGLLDLAPEVFRNAHPLLDEKMVKLLNVNNSLKARSSHGGTAPDRVVEQLVRLGEYMAEEQDWLKSKLRSA